MEHSESNAILNSKGCVLEGCTFYITGHPCSACFRQMRIVKAAKIIHGGQGSQCVAEDDINAIKVMNYTNPIVIRQHNNEDVRTTAKAIYEEALFACIKAVDKEEK